MALFLIIDQNNGTNKKHQHTLLSPIMPENIAQ